MNIGNGLEVEGDILVLEFGVMGQVKIRHARLQLFGGDLIMQGNVCPAWIPYPAIRHTPPGHFTKGGKRSQEIYFEMALRGQILQDSGNLHDGTFLHMQDLPHGRFIPEIPFRC